MKNKETNVFKISFICAVMVIALHSYDIVNLAGGNIVISYISRGLATVAVPTFFFLSGYLLFKHVDNIATLFEKMKKRFRNLIVPYICWNILYFLFYVVFNYSAVDTSVLGVVEGIFFHKYCFNLWFLLNLIVFTYVCSIPTFYLLKTKWIWGVWAILFGSTFVAELGVNIYLTDVKISLFSVSYFVYWLLGVICSKKKIPISGKLWCLVGLLVCSVGVMYVKETGALWRLECLLVLANMIFFMQSAKIWLSHMREPKYNMNMILYGGAGMIQIIYIKVISIMLTKVAISTGLVLLLYVFEIILATVVCYYVGILMKKYVGQGYRLLAGNR